MGCHCAGWCGRWSRGRRHRLAFRQVELNRPSPRIQVAIEIGPVFGDRTDLETAQ